MRLAKIAFVLGSIIACQPGLAALVNGNFSAGNTSFTTGYTYSQTDSQSVGGFYTVGNDPHAFNFGAATFGDHTTGTGLMLLVDGSPSANAIVWSQTTVVTPTTNYRFSGFGASWGQLGNGIDPSPARLQVLLNGVALGPLHNLAAQNGQWSLFERDFNVGSATSITLTIIDSNTAFTGNDFALDDLALTVVPEPQGFLASFAAGCILLHRHRRR